MKTKGTKRQKGADVYRAIEKEAQKFVSAIKDLLQEMGSPKQTKMSSRVKKTIN